MFRRPKTDFWQVGIIPAPIQTLDAAAMQGLRDRITWLPSAGSWRYLADPFGLYRGGGLHVFVEAFDYRSKHATIERHEFDAAGRVWRGHCTVLARPFHLSYPYVFEHQGECFMVPESYQANEIALYRAVHGLDKWHKEIVLLKNMPGVDASLIEYQGQWWMFFAIVGPQARDRRELHLAVAPRLSGPWQRWQEAPIHVGLEAARPAGRPFVAADGSLHVPVQDSSISYGCAVRVLRVTQSPQGAIGVEPLSHRFTGDLVSTTYAQGCHTLSACGDVTLIDVKCIDRSRGKQWLDLQRRVRRLMR